MMVIKGYIKLVLALSFMLLAGTLFMGTEGAYAMSNDTQSKKAVKNCPDCRSAAVR